MDDRLYRSEREKMLAGVCGGLAEYFDVDVTLVRLIALIAILAGGAGILAYIIAWIIIPLNPSAQSYRQRPQNYEPGRNYGAGAPYRQEPYQGKEAGHVSDEEMKQAPGASDEIQDAEIREPDETKEPPAEGEKGQEQNFGGQETNGEDRRPREDDQGKNREEREDRSYHNRRAEQGWSGKGERKVSKGRNGNKAAGLILIVLGLLFFIDRWFPWYSFDKTWPLFIIALGLFVIFRQRR